MGHAQSNDIASCRRRCDPELAAQAIERTDPENMPTTTQWLRRVKELHADENGGEALDVYQEWLVKGRRPEREAAGWSR